MKEPETVREANREYVYWLKINHQFNAINRQLLRQRPRRYRMVYNIKRQLRHNRVPLFPYSKNWLKYYPF